eukprot:TRINITY_DN23969_c0_g1_i14.p3 TRINITY_DN23969_c0_g1~~TRINITY_DN23969_c0_g1_i14.p3  ORF type:complete len:198 (-),score=-14.74 TRINITY_DN23969_c0_g1_i14:727-1320(-)
MKNLLLPFLLIKYNNIRGMLHNYIIMIHDTYHIITLSRHTIRLQLLVLLYLIKVIQATYITKNNKSFQYQLFYVITKMFYQKKKNRTFILVNSQVKQIKKMGRNITKGSTYQNNWRTYQNDCFLDEVIFMQYVVNKYKSISNLLYSLINITNLLQIKLNYVNLVYTYQQYIQFNFVMLVTIKTWQKQIVCNGRLFQG